MNPRKKINYVLSNKKIFVGLEDSKKTWKICVRSDRRIVHETTLPADYDNLHNYFTNKFPSCDIHVIYEAGFRGFNLYDQLTADNIACTVTPPHSVTEPKCQKKKNDRIDCRRLAKVLENEDCGECFIPDKELRTDRSVERLYIQIDKKLVQVKNQIRRTLEFHGMDKEFEEGIWTDAYYITVQRMISGNEDHMPEELFFTFKMLFDQLLLFRQQKKDTVKRLRTIGQKPRYKKLMELYQSAPGIGFLSAITYVLELGDITRFNRKEEYCSFIGMIPSDFSTAEMDHKGHITKQGNRRIRKFLVEASWIAIRKDPALLEAFNRIARNTASKKKAIVAIARKLALRLRAIAQTGIPYQIGVIE